MTIVNRPRNRYYSGLVMSVVFTVFLAAGIFTAPKTVQAVNSTVITVNCTNVYVVGVTTLAAPYIRVTVSLASDLNVTLAKRVIRVRNIVGAKFYVQLNFRPQPVGTRLIVAVGEWNGTAYMQPTTLVGKECGVRPPNATSVPTLTPSASTVTTPQIVLLRGYTLTCPGAVVLCATVTWETVNAQRVNLSSGHFDGTTFYKGNEFFQDYLPLNGTLAFRHTTGNDDAQLCAEAGGYWVCRIVDMR